MHIHAPHYLPHLLQRLGFIFIIGVVIYGVYGTRVHASVVFDSPPQSIAGILFDSTQRTPQTISSFDTETITEYESIPYDSVIEYSDAMYTDEEEVSQIGVNGEIVREYQRVLWQNEEVARELMSTSRTEPVSEIRIVGTQQRVYTMNTDIGALEYTQHFSMWSTSYDGNCLGCSGVTATGTRVYHGICAVDPNVIALGSRVYIPGYGECLAADTGGAIQGNVIDLGFEDVRNGWWSARWTDVYLLK